MCETGRGKLVTHECVFRFFFAHMEKRPHMEMDGLHVHGEFEHKYQQQYIAYSTTETYVYNMDTGLVETRPQQATIDEAALFQLQTRRKQGGITGGTGGEQASGRTSGDISHYDLTTNNYSESHCGEEKHPSEQSRQIFREVVDSSQAAASDEKTSESPASFGQTVSIVTSQSIPESENTAADGGYSSAITDALSEKIVSTSLGSIAYTDATKIAQYQEMTVEYDMVAERENTNLDSPAPINDNNCFANKENDATPAINGSQDKRNSVAPVSETTIDQEAEIVTLSPRSGMLRNYAVILQLPPGDKYIESGKIIYMNINNATKPSHRNGIAELKRVTETANQNETRLATLCQPTEINASPLNRVATITNGELSKNNLAHAAEKILASDTHSPSVLHFSQNDADNAKKSGSFQEPPCVSRKVGIFGDLVEHEERECSPSSHCDDENAENDPRHATVPNIAPPVPTIPHFGCVVPLVCPLYTAPDMAKFEDKASNLSNKPFPEGHALPLPGFSHLITQSTTATRLVRPMPVPPAQQLPPCGLRGIPAAVPFPFHRPPVVPMPLPPLAVFTHPIHLFSPPAVTYPWQLENQLSTSVFHRISNQFRERNCPHYHSTTAALTSTAKLAATSPLLKRGRRYRRSKFAPSPAAPGSPPHTSDSDGPLPPTKRTEANARERERVNHLNYGFDQLRKVLPWSHRNGRRISKVDTLRAAIAYIGFLESILVGSDTPSAAVLRVSNGIALDGSIKLSNVSPPHVAAGMPLPPPTLQPRYPVLPAGCRFLHPPPPMPHTVVPIRHPLPPGQAPGAVHVPVVQMRPAQLPPATQPVPMCSTAHTASLSCSQTSQSTALSWLINVHAANENLRMSSVPVPLLETNGGEAANESGDLHVSNGSKSHNESDAAT